MLTAVFFLDACSIAIRCRKLEQKDRRDLGKDSVEHSAIMCNPHRLLEHVYQYMIDIYYFESINFNQSVGGILPYAL